MSGDKAEEFTPVQPVPETEEIAKLSEFFMKKYDSTPDFYVKVPGRVNLIGEHIDYCGYSVCPIAIQQHILVAVKSSNNTNLSVSNIETKYEDYECDLNSFSIDVNGAPKWYQYFLCGVKGIIETLPSNEENNVQPQGFYAAVFGNIPPSSGLSSSSALVSAAVLSTAKVHKLELTKNKMADIAAKCERYIGTQGGGMDQAIAFLGTPGCAKLISFNPLHAENIELPEGAVFVIANSLAEKNKAASSDYNCRVVECRLASQVFAKRLNFDWRKIKTFKEIQALLPMGVAHLRAMAVETLHEKPYTKNEICFELCVTEEELNKTSLTENTKHIQEFKLRQRALHVLEEAGRVYEFAQTCSNTAKGKLKSNESLWRLGDLMKKSHQSLKDNYECSHEELDKITEIAGRAFTLGARLTGAGWGGCTVALTTSDKVENYITMLKEEFYKNKPSADLDDIDSYVFATEPGQGAVVYSDQ